MMNVNINRSAKYLLILIAVIGAAGCSSSSKAPVSSSYKPQAVSVQHQYAVRHSAQSRMHLAFKKRQQKTASNRFNTVWDRLLSMYSLPAIENERVDRQLNWYLSHPDYIARVQQRAQPYLHLILDEVEAKNIPGELALLPVVESAFIPEAYSKSDASGLWQFIPATGRLFGLEQNAWYDGRRDVYASTKAATTFLKHLGETFNGDWYLALAAYNFGKGNVRKAIEKNENLDLPTDYWSLDLPKETDEYVPRLLAVAKLFANAESYNIPLQYIPNRPYVQPVDIKAPLDLSKAAEMANTPLSHFLKLNPGFNRSCTAPDGPHRLLIPVNQVQTFTRNLAQLPFDERVDYKQIVAQQAAHSKKPRVKTSRKTYGQSAIVTSRYKVKPGDTLTAIAVRTHTTINHLRRMNHLGKSAIRSNMVIKVPGPIKPANPPSIAVAAKSKAAGSQIYTVKKGDTFWNIAQRFSVTPKEIASWNKMTLATALIPGKKLTLKTDAPQLASTTSIRLIRYVVNKGDTLMKISRKFNVSITDIRKSNADTLVRGLQSGQKLKIFVDASVPAT